MKLNEFKKRLKQLEEELLTEYGLTEEEVEVFILEEITFNAEKIITEKVHKVTMYMRSKILIH